MITNRATVREPSASAAHAGRLPDWWAVLAVGVSAAVPWFASEYLLRAVLIPFLILALAALGLNLLVGYCGQISLGTGAFMAIGAYAAYNVQVRIDGMPLVVALLFGGVCAAAAAVLAGLPSLRIRSLYLAVATLAVQFFADWLFLRVRWFTADSASGAVSVASMRVFDVDIGTPERRYLLCLTFVVALMWIAKNLVASATGRAWAATRDMEVAASVVGLRPAHAKLTAFAVSGFFIGIAGGLWGFVHLGSWEPAAFSLDRSFQVLFMVIIGGLGSLAGPLLGAAFFVVLPIALEVLPHAVGLPLDTAMASNLAVMILGALIVIVLIVEPRGLARWVAVTPEFKKGDMR